MIQLLTAQCYTAIEAVLRQSSRAFAESSDGRWQFVLAAGPPLPVTASIDAAFLLLDAPAPAEFDLEQAPRWLQWNATLPGAAKFALVPNPWRLRLRAEMPVDDACISERIAAALLGFRNAASLLQRGPAVAEAFAVSPVAAAVPASAPDLRVLLRETGWPFQERPDGAVSIDLALRGESCRVVIDMNAAAPRAAMELLRADLLPPASRLAVPALLLSASGSLRMSRAFAIGTDGHFACGFEVQLAGAPTAVELEFALEALAVAGWACKDELQSLLDHSVARTFLAVRNLNPLPVEEE